MRKFKNPETPEEIKQEKQVVMAGTIVMVGLCIILLVLYFIC